MIRKAARGFTLIELMIVVAIIGILAAIAIPNFLRYQLRSKSGEAPVNLAAIKTSELAYYASRDAYVTTGPNPQAVPGSSKAKFEDPMTTGITGWKDLGWKPEGQVYFQYHVDTDSANGGAFSAVALGDIDASSVNQCWLFVKPDNVPETPGTATLTNSTGCTPVDGRFNVVYKASSDGEY